MPELPEVEIMAQNLDRWLGGRRILEVQTPDEKFQGVGLDAVVGSTVRRAWRRAKYAVVDLDCGRSLVFHYRMTGKTVLDPEGLRRARLRIVVEPFAVVSFEDVRRFGEVWCMPTAELSDFFDRKSLGPEPWPDVRGGPWWAEALAGLRGPIKTVMMRQERVAGVGNIIASEALFLAGIDPRVSAVNLDDEQWSRLAQGVRTVIDRTLDAESGDEIAYVNAGGEGSFLVYGHAGEPCPRCGDEIVRIVQASRGTFYCPSCVG